MQILLTKPEYDDLVPSLELRNMKEAMRAALKIIIDLGEIPCQKYVCDDCPVHNIDPYNISKLICTKNRNCSK